MRQKHKSPEIEREILKLPYQTQRDFRNALKPHLFTSESFVPTRYEGKKIETKKNILRNKLIDFHQKIKQKKLIISQISKETNIFSKGYKGVSIENNVNKQIKRDKMLYEEILKKYQEQGFDANQLLNDKNEIFRKSVFLEKNNNFRNSLHVTGKNEGIQLQQYLEKVDNILKGNYKKENFTFKTEVKFKENSDNDEEDEFKLTKTQLKQKIKKLKIDINKIKKTIENMNLNYNSDNNTYRTISYLDGNNNDYQNIISSTKTSYFDIYNNTKSKLNSTNDTYYTYRHKKNKSHNLNTHFSNNLKNFVSENTESEESSNNNNNNVDNQFKTIETVSNDYNKIDNNNINDNKDDNKIDNNNKINDNKDNNNIKNIPINKIENLNNKNNKNLISSQSNIGKKSRNHKSFLMNEHLIYTFSPNSFRRTSALNQIQLHNDKDYKDISKRMNQKIKKKLKIEMENDLHKLYENVKKKTFEESENEIIDYLKKYNKKIPEREK